MNIDIDTELRGRGHAGNPPRLVATFRVSVKSKTMGGWEELQQIDNQAVEQHPSRETIPLTG